MKKVISLLFITLFVAITAISCGSVNTTETNTGAINLFGEIDLIIPEKNRVTNFKFSERFTAVASLSSSHAYIDVYDNQRGQVIYNIEESFDDFRVSRYEISNDYLVYLGVNLVNNKIEVKSYAFEDEQFSTLTVDDRTDLSTYESPLQLYGDYILVNLYTSYPFQGRTYIIDAHTLSPATLLTTYDIGSMILDGTYEVIYGGANQIINNKIAMTTHYYTYTYNQVDIFNPSDGLIYKSLTAEESENQTCNIFNAQVLGSYIVLKTSCTNDIERFVIYDIEEDAFTINIDLPYSNGSHKVKSINEDYVLLSDGNFTKDDSKVFIYERDSNILTEIPHPLNDLDFFGSVSYLVNNQVVFVNDQSLYVYNLEDKAYLLLEEDFDIQNIFGVYQDYFVFHEEKDGKSKIYLFDLNNHQFELIYETDTYSFLLKIDDNRIFILDRNEEDKLYIYN